MRVCFSKMGVCVLKVGVCFSKMKVCVVTVGVCFLKIFEASYKRAFVYTRFFYKIQYILARLIVRCYLLSSSSESILGLCFIYVSFYYIFCRKTFEKKTINFVSLTLNLILNCLMLARNKLLLLASYYCNVFLKNKEYHRLPRLEISHIKNFPYNDRKKSL